MLGIKSHSQCSVAKSSTVSIFLNHGALCFMLYKISCSFESDTYSTPLQALAASLVCRACGHLFQPQLLLEHLTWNGHGPNSCGRNSIAPWVQSILCVPKLSSPWRETLFSPPVLMQAAWKHKGIPALISTEREKAPCQFCKTGITKKTAASDDRKVNSHLRVSVYCVSGSLPSTSHMQLLISSRPQFPCP